MATGRWTTDLRRLATAAAVVLLLLAAVEPAAALKFVERHTPDGRWILLVYDCGILPEDREQGCHGWERGFRVANSYPDRSGRATRYHGDAVELDQRLRARRYGEVWLYSGGGHLQAGIDMGRVLRQHRMTVRVPAGARCISACTVAFMGGLFRFVDEGATYEVHAGSAVLMDVSPERREAVQRGEFELLARRSRVTARMTARQLLTHFQNTLIIPLGTRPQPENDDVFWRWAQNYPPPPFYTQQQAERDRRRVATEGLAVVQDILMRIEREAMEAAVADLRAMIGRGELGRRAEPALRMVEAMYDVGILETAVLTRETMLRMGYITHEVPAERRN